MYKLKRFKSSEKNVEIFDSSRLAVRRLRPWPRSLLTPASA